MAERGWGRIVNVASSAGKRPSSLTNAAYSVTKAAQLSLSRVFADTYADARRAGQRRRAGRRRQLALWMDEGGLGDQTAAARGMLARGGARGPGEQGAARPLRASRRRSRRSSPSCAPSVRRWSPAPRGRSTAAPSRRSCSRAGERARSPPPRRTRRGSRAARPRPGRARCRPGRRRSARRMRCPARRARPCPTRVEATADTPRPPPMSRKAGSERRRARGASSTSAPAAIATSPPRHGSARRPRAGAARAASR